MPKKELHKQPRSNENSILVAPSVDALLIQLVALFPTWAIVRAADVFADFPLPMLACAMVQGVLAALLTRWRRLARWWVGIQFVFPILIVAAQALHLPSWLFLVAFLLSIGLYWSTFRTQVPFFPSTPHTWNTVAAMLPSERAIRFVDIGSGFGGLALHLSALRPESDFSGVEIAPLPWLVSAVRSRARGNRSRFIRRDYRRLDFSSYDVVFAYLSPAAMPALWHKARAEMRAGALLLSYEFTVPGIEPQIVSLPDESGASVYGWSM